MTEQQSRSRNTPRDALTVAAANVALPAAAFATSPILAHSLGVGGRGAVSAATALVLLASTIATAGLPEAVTYYSARQPEAGRRIVKTALPLLSLTATISIVICFILAPTVANDKQLSPHVIMICALSVLPTLYLAALRAQSQGIGEWWRVNLEKYITAASRIIILLGLLATDNLNTATAAVTIVFTPTLGTAAYVGSLRRSHDCEPGAGYRKLTHYGARVWFGSLSGVLLARLDQVIFSPLGGLYELGLYAVAVNVSDLLLIANTAIASIMFSKDASDPNSDRAYLASRIAFLISIVSAFLLAASVSWWLPILFGSDFRPAIPAVMILLAATTLGVPGSVAGTILGARGRPELRSISLIIALVGNVVAMALLVPEYGAKGAATATLVGNVLAANVVLLFAKREFGMSFWKFYLIRPSDFIATVSLVRSATRRAS